MRKNHLDKPEVAFTDRCFTVEETAAHLTVSRGYIFKLIKQGSLTPTKLGSRTLIRGAELRRLLDAADAA